MNFELQDYIVGLNSWLFNSTVINDSKRPDIGNKFNLAIKFSGHSLRNEENGASLLKLETY